MDKLPGRSLSCPLWNPFEIVPQMCDARKTRRMVTIDAVDVFFMLSVSFSVTFTFLYICFCLGQWATRVYVRIRPEDTERINNALQEPVHKCSICILPRAIFPVVINCGHVFCCECIIGWWLAKNSPLDPTTCPYCRRMFTKLIPIQWSTDPEDPEIKKNMDVYNRRFDSNRSVIEPLEEFRIWLWDPLSLFSIFLCFMLVFSFTFICKIR